MPVIVIVINVNIINNKTHSVPMCGWMETLT